MKVSQSFGKRSAQSRIGKRPVIVPERVEVKLNGNRLSVKGPIGLLERDLPPEITIELRDKILIVSPKADTGRDGKRLQGLYRALVANMMEGVSKGFSASLELYGIGYRAEIKNNELNLSLGYSHPVHFPLPEFINVQVETFDQGGIKRPRLRVTSHDKELLGRTVALIRSFRPPEPYKGKGIRYTGEHIREKAGKSGAKTQ